MGHGAWSQKTEVRRKAIKSDFFQLLATGYWLLATGFFGSRFMLSSEEE